MGPGRVDPINRDWLKKIQPATPALLKRGQELGFNFEMNPQQLVKKGKQQATTLEWAKRITADDIQILAGTRPFTR